MKELEWLTAAEISAAYAARKLSPVELVQALIARIETRDPKVGAFISVDARPRSTPAPGRKDIAGGRTLGP